MREIFLVFIAIASLAGCEGKPPGNSKVAEKVTIAFTFQPQSTLVHVAMAKNYFAEEGIQVEGQMYTFGKAALQSVLDKQADFATVAETPIMFSVLKGEKIAVVANIERSSTNNAVVAGSDTGISTPGDLKGKRIGFTPGTTSDFFLDSLLAAARLTRKDIIAIPLKPEEMLDAITAKTVDAVSTWNYPLTQIQQSLGGAATTLFDREIYTEMFNIAALRDLVEQKPETVKRLLRALIKAEVFVEEHPDEAQDIVARATSIDKRLVRDVWRVFHYSVTLDASLQIALEDEARWAMKNRLTDQTVMPDFARFIHQDSLKAVKPDAVLMTH